MREPARRRATGTTWSARCTSCATRRSTSTATTSWDIWRAATPTQVWTRYFETLGEAARSGLFDILAHPDLVKVWGSARARARAATCAASTSARWTAIAESRRRDRGLDRRAAQAGRRDLPRPRVPRDVPRGRAARSRCRATRTRPSSSATSYERGRRAARATSGVTRARRVRAARAAAGADRMSGAPASASTRTGSTAGRAAGARRRRDPEPSAASPATPTPTCSPTR